MSQRRWQKHQQHSHTTAISSPNYIMINYSGQDSYTSSTVQYMLLASDYINYNGGSRKHHQCSHTSSPDCTNFSGHDSYTSSTVQSHTRYIVTSDCINCSRCNTWLCHDPTPMHTSDILLTLDAVMCSRIVRNFNRTVTY